MNFNNNQVCQVSENNGFVEDLTNYLRQYIHNKRYKSYKCYKCHRRGHIASMCGYICEKCNMIHNSSFCVVDLVNTVEYIKDSPMKKYFKNYKNLDTRLEKACQSFDEYLQSTKQEALTRAAKKLNYEELYNKAVNEVSETKRNVGVFNYTFYALSNVFKSQMQMKNEIENEISDKFNEIKNNKLEKMMQSDATLATTQMYLDKVLLKNEIMEIRRQFNKFKNNIKEYMKKEEKKINEKIEEFKIEKKKLAEKEVEEYKKALKTGKSSEITKYKLKKVRLEINKVVKDIENEQHMFELATKERKLEYRMAWQRSKENELLNHRKQVFDLIYRAKTQICNDLRDQQNFKRFGIRGSLITYRDNYIIDEINRAVMKNKCEKFEDVIKAVEKYFEEQISLNKRLFK